MLFLFYLYHLQYGQLNKLRTDVSATPFLYVMPLILISSLKVAVLSHCTWNLGQIFSQWHSKLITISPYLSYQAHPVFSSPPVFPPHPYSHFCALAAPSYMLFPEFHNILTFTYWSNRSSCHYFSIYMIAFHIPDLDQCLQKASSCF